MTSIIATYAQIDALREEALTHGDIVMARICDLAISGFLRWSDVSSFSRADRSRLCAMTQTEALSICDRVICGARGEVTS